MTPADRMAAGTAAGLELVGLNELAVIDRWALERRARALAQPVFLGGSTALCRCLGRYKMFVDTGDVGFGAHMLLDGFWESWLTVFIARRIKPGMMAADVGANHGYYSLLMADLAGPGGRVAAVEPNPRITPLLRRTLELNGFAGRAQVFEAAAGDRDGGTVWLSTPPGEPKNAHVVADPAGHGEVAEAPAARLATLLADWPRLDFVKVDVEGAEEAAIDGLWPILERDHPRMVLEFNRHRCRDPEGLLARLQDLYGALRCVDLDGEAPRVHAAEVLDEARIDDWLLFLGQP
ncbi:FkbM family methyltransferase [Caulobacter sp. KR2-114]|uniref:FkbM family methyltransferase n=1 Tax=Caulobacter sp. KR2-114 TaxID=3400912 RepID=UPI003C0B8B89